MSAYTKYATKAIERTEAAQVAYLALSISIARGQKMRVKINYFLPSGERGLALGAPVFSVAGVQLDVAVPAALVLEETRAEFAAERHVLRVALQQTKRIDYYSVSLHKCQRRGCNLRAMIAGLAQTQIIIISRCCHRSLCYYLSLHLLRATSGSTH